MYRLVSKIRKFKDHQFVSQVASTDKVEEAKWKGLCVNDDWQQMKGKGFEVKVGMHQGSALSPLLFVIVMKAISREFRVALPWKLLYADDLAVIAETEKELIKRLNDWKDNVETKGMRVKYE